MSQEHPPAEPATIEDLFAEHGALVLRLAGLFGVAEPERDDVAQEVWIDVHRALPLFDPSKGTERAWIASITRHAAQDWKRTRRRRPEFSWSTDQEPPDLGAVDAESDAVQAQRREALHAFLEQAIPVEEQRVALVMHEIEGLTVAEVATATGVKRCTAKWRIEMARTRLKKAAASLSDEERERFRALVLPLGSVDGILRALRETAPPVSDEQLARVWDRVVERIEAEGGSIHDPIGAQAPRPAAPDGHTFTGGQIAGALGTVFVLGALSGAAAHALLSDGGVRASITSIEAEVRSAPVSTSAPLPEPVPTASAAPTASSSPAPGPWISEGWMLDRARQGGPAEALRQADRHARHFPRSVNAAEREELAIGALLKLGRRAEAEERAARLLEWAPSRRPAIEKLLSTSFL